MQGVFGADMKCCGIEFVIFFGLIRYGSAIVCYECNSAINPLCSEAFLYDDRLKRNCSDHDRGITHTLCRKIIQYVDHDINGHLPVGRVIRSCGWDESKYMNACYHRSGYGGRQEVCSCSTDLCNGSTIQKLGTTYFIIGAALLNVLQMQLSQRFVD